MKSSLEFVWQNLQKVQRFFVKTATSSGGWEGKGEIQIEHLSPNHMVFREMGSWDSGISFTNTLSWKWEKDKIVVEHWRQGSQAAVFLVDLVELGPRLLSSEKPHLCGLDIYCAKVFWDADSLFLEWHCQGPKKNDLLQYRYL